MTPLVSVIIPVYNTKDFLLACVTSICAQSYNHTEIILVDDGSTDGSGAVCDSIAKTYTCQHCDIAVFHKENGGLADARNYGLLQAKGEYILFLDSDDYYPSNRALGALVQAAAVTDSDVVCFNYSRSENLRPERRYPYPFTSDIADLITRNVYTSSACLKLIKKERLTQDDITFVKGQQSEDILFSARLLLDPACKISFVNEVFYFYRVREDSLTQTLHLKNIADTIDILHALEGYGGVSSAQHSAPAESRKNLLAYTAFQYATLLINIHRCGEKIPAEMLAEIYAMHYLLQYHRKGIVRGIHLCVGCIGIRATSHLMALAFQAKQRFVR